MTISAEFYRMSKSYTVHGNRNDFPKMFKGRGCKVGPRKYKASFRYGYTTKW